MKIHAVLVLTCCLIFISSGTQAQIKTWPLLNLFFKNQFDKNGNHHGRWVFTTDAVGDNESMVSKGRYKHGLMIGQWKTFDANRKLRKVEKSLLVDSTSLIETSEFFQNGQLKKQGIAVLDKSGPSPRFYLKGEWTYFLENGTPDKKVLYENGWGVLTTYANGKVIKSPAPPVVLPKKPQNQSNTRSGVKMIRKGNEIITIQYKENGDSTVQITPVKPLN